MLPHRWGGTQTRFQGLSPPNLQGKSPGNEDNFLSQQYFVQRFYINGKIGKWRQSIRYYCISQREISDFCLSF